MPAVLLCLTGCGGGDAPRSYPVGGAISGVAGSGLVLSLNGGSDLAISVPGPFTFATPLAAGTSYAVTVKTQPVNPSQTCVVSNGAGAVASSPITDVSVGCATDRYAVGGTVSGLEGNGLVLRLNGASDLSVSGDGSFSFPGALASGAPFAVTIRSQPSTPAQTCLATGAAGVIGGGPVNVTVTCTTDRFSVGGTVAGLAGKGLVLQLNGAQDLTIDGDGGFAFPTKLLRGVSYTVTVKSQTSTYREICALDRGVGANLQADVTNLKVACDVVAGYVYAIDSQNGLLGFGIKPDTGALLPLGAVGAVGAVGALNSSKDMAVTSDGKFLYVADRATSRIYQFEVDPAKGGLKPVGAPVVSGSATSGATNLLVGASGKFLYVSNGADATLVRFNIDQATGALSLPTQVATAVKYASSYFQKTAITPDGAYLYLLSVEDDPTGVSSLTVYAVDASTGALTPRATSTPTASGLAMDPLGRFVYLYRKLPGPSTFSNATVWPYAIDPGTGALTASGSPTTVSSTGAQLLVEPRGRFAYLLGALNYVPEDNHIDAFAIDPSNGTLAVIGAPAVIPGHPASAFVMDGTGSFLFTTNRRLVGSFDAEIFPYDGATFRINMTSANSGQLSSAGNGASLTTTGLLGIIAIP